LRAENGRLRTLLGLSQRFPSIHMAAETNGRVPVFDPRRTAILLAGGDKTNEWSAWYERAIPEADRLYDEHLAELREEGTYP
jgi:hypothetical protein